MAIIIENEMAATTINEHGAELVSLIDKTTGKEYIWSADAKYWNRHAPILFPLVGRVKNDTYNVDGQTYHLAQHGFARNMDFNVIAQEDNKVTFELHSNAKTKEVYPYDFILRVSYTLVAKSVKVDYEVENPTDEEIWFGIGGHPGFKIPLAKGKYYDDYSVTLLPKTTRNIIPLKDGYADIDNLKEERTSEIEITHQRFKDDAVILDLGEEPTTITLSPITGDDQHGIKMTTCDAKFLGIWSSYPQKGQFVCLEPWWSITDSVDSDQDFKHKFANSQLGAHQTFNAMYEITIF